jgi:type III secretory pathway component EscU
MSMAGAVVTGSGMSSVKRCSDVVKNKDAVLTCLVRVLEDLPSELLICRYPKYKR